MEPQENLPSNGDTPQIDQSVVYDNAIAFTKSGRSVIYILPSTKFPKGTNWKEHQDKPATEDTLHKWFANKHRGVCLITGKISGTVGDDGIIYGLEIFDFDEPKLYEQFCEQAGLCGLGELIARLPAETTPSGGAHVGYLCSTWKGNQKLAYRDANDIELARKPHEKIKGRIETRGEGGLCVVAPTPIGIHPDVPERGYEMICGSWTNIPIITPDERQQLLDIARSYHTAIRPLPGAEKLLASQMSTDANLPGGDLNLRVDRQWWRSLLEKHDWTLLYTRKSDDVQMWQRPGKEGAEVSATLGATGNGLYVFSTNAHPIPGQRYYSPYSAYIQLEHRGDAGAAAKALSKEGYGKWARKSDSLKSQPKKVGADESWQSIRDNLEFTKDGGLKESLLNYSKVLSSHPYWKGRITFDEFSSSVLIDRKVITDEAETEIGLWCAENQGMTGGAKTARHDAIYAVAKRAPIDILKEYLNNLRAWDGTQRLEQWIINYCAAPNDAYTRWVSKVIIVQMIARGLVPGCIARYVMILEGVEDTGKSTIALALGAPWSITFDSSFDSKEAHMAIQGCWVAELSELDTLSRSQETRVKSFISQTTDDYIPKYMNYRTNRPRRTVFIGTTNEEAQYLVGQTGNTRFLPIKTGSIDVAAVRKIREQLFAEAREVFENSPATWWQYPKGLEQVIKDEREDRRIALSWEAVMEDWLDKETGQWKEDYVLLSDVMKRCLRIGTADWTRHQKKAGAAMSAIGWKPRRLRTEAGTRQRFYVRPIEP